MRAGACPSFRVTVRTFVAMLPELSRAVTVMTFAPTLSVTAATLQLVVPVAVMFGGAIWSGLFGWLASEDAHDRAGVADAD